MFPYFSSQRTCRLATLTLSLGMAVALLWLLTGAIAPAQALTPDSELGRPASVTPLAFNASLTVTNANDDGPGSLRQAIAAAGGGDIITFDNSYSIYLSSTLEISKQLTIDGSSHSITISGDSLNDGSRDVRVFLITSTAVVTLNHLNIVSGTANLVDGMVFPGGGIYVNSGSQLTVQSSTLASNIGSYPGGGIYNAGRLTLANSIITGNSTSSAGGGVSNAGNLTVWNSIFVNNISYGNGGGVYNDDGTLAIADSTFTSNYADYGGGGIAGWGTFTLTNARFVSNTSTVDGGGIFIDDGQMILQDSSLIGNISGFGGGVASYDNLVLVNSTIAGNIATYSGGGLYNYGILTATNSTFSGNMSQGSDADFDGGGAIDQWGPTKAPPKAVLTNVTFSGNDAPNVTGRDGVWVERGSLQLYNVLLTDNGTNNCTIKTGALLTATTNSMADDSTCVGATAVPSTSLILAPLADNGGSTWTHALLSGSPAIDAGDDATCPLADQRGIARSQGAHCDIGAYEYQSTSNDYTLDVTTTGIGSGVVLIDPSSPYYAAGTLVTLTAVPSLTSRFAGWSGGIMTTTNPLVMTMDGNKIITATFVTHRVFLPLVIR